MQWIQTEYPDATCTTVLTWRVGADGLLKSDPDATPCRACHRLLQHYGSPTVLVVQCDGRLRLFDYTENTKWSSGDRRRLREKASLILKGPSILERWQLNLLQQRRCAIQTM